VDAEQDVPRCCWRENWGQVHAKRGERRQFLAAMQEITAARGLSPDMLEFMGELFNGANGKATTADSAETLRRVLRYGGLR